MTSNKGETGASFTKNKKALIVFPSVAVAAIIISIFFVFSSPDLSLPSETEPIAPQVNNDNPIIALVNDEEIRQDTVEDTIEAMQLQTGQRIDNATALDRLVTITLLLQEAENRGIEVPLNDAKTELDNRISQSGQTIEDFKQTLQQQGTTYEKTLESFQEQLIIDELLSDEIDVGQLQISDQEAKSFFDQNIDAIRQQAGDEVTFDAVSSQIKNLLSQQKQQQALSEFLTSLKSDAEIITYEDRM